MRFLLSAAEVAFVSSEFSASLFVSLVASFSGDYLPSSVTSISSYSSSTTGAAATGSSLFFSSSWAGGDFSFSILSLAAFSSGIASLAGYSAYSSVV